MSGKIHSHDEAIGALCGCAATVTVLSYQEAIEGYFTLRGITLDKIDALSDKVKHIAWYKRALEQ